MKLRLQRGSVRVRLSEDEVRTLNDVDELFESVELTASGKNISYMLTVNELSNSIRLHFNKDIIQILIPRNKLDTWLSSGDVGIQEILDFGHHENLTIVIEKDLSPKEKRKFSAAK